MDTVDRMTPEPHAVVRVVVVCVMRVVIVTVGIVAGQNGAHEGSPSIFRLA